MDTPPKNRHDLLFQATLSRQRRAQSVLRAHLEPWIADLLDESPPTPLDGSFVDDRLRASQSDKLLQVTLRKGRKPAFVYALLERKSHPDPGTALQIHKYKARIWERYAQGKAERLRALPPILPLVFYHGRRKWTAPRSPAEMVAAEDERLRELEPSFGYYLRDLGALPPERLAADREARAGLPALRYSHHGDKGVEEKPGCCRTSWGRCGRGRSSRGRWCCILSTSGTCGLRRCGRWRSACSRAREAR